MAIQIIKDGQVIVDDNKTKEKQKTNEERIIEDLQNQIKDLKSELRFYKVHCK